MREEFKNSHLWYKHFLPHYKAENKYQMITYRLADSLPQKVLKSLTYLGSPQSSAGKDPELQKRKTIESTLDRGYGSCLLSIPDIAQKVIDTWKFYDKDKYELIAYVVMPNHVHVLIKTLNSWELGKIVWAWKSYVTNYVLNNESYKSKLRISLESSINYTEFANIPEERLEHIKNVKTSGEFKIRFWNREYWDRFIRDENHFLKAIEYIHMNPVKAGLASKADQWKWSSAYKS